MLWQSWFSSTPVSKAQEPYMEASCSCCSLGHRAILASRRVSHDGVTDDLLSSGSQSNLQSVHFARSRLSKQLGVIESSIAVSFCSEEPRTQPTTSLTMLRRGLASLCLSLLAALARSQYTPGKSVDALLRSHDVRSRPSIHTFGKHICHSDLGFKVCTRSPQARLPASAASVLIGGQHILQPREGLPLQRLLLGE